MPISIRSFDDLVTLLSNSIDAAEAAQQTLAGASGAAAERDKDYKLAWARAYTAAHGDSHAARTVVADGKTVEQRYQAKLAENLRVAALENVRTKRTALTAVQTLTNAWREEVGLARGAPQ